jgi:hypothetical protein
MGSGGSPAIGAGGASGLREGASGFGAAAADFDAESWGALMEPLVPDAGLLGLNSPESGEGI